jgi:hypothetical protein
MAVFCLFDTTVFAQEKDKSDKTERKRDFCAGNNYSSSGKVSYKESREVTMNAVSLLGVDGQRNGGISVKGENRSDVLIRACIQTMGATDEEAQAAAKTSALKPAQPFEPKTRRTMEPGQFHTKFSFRARQI